MDLEIAEVPPVELSLEEKERLVTAALETLNSSLSLLSGKLLMLNPHL